MFATVPHQVSSCCKSSCGCTNMCFNLLSFNFCKKSIFVCLTRERWLAIYGAWDLVLEIFTTAIYRQLHSSNDIRDRERDGSMIAIEDLKAGIRDAESSLDQYWEEGWSTQFCGQQRSFFHSMLLPSPTTPSCYIIGMFPSTLDNISSRYIHLTIYTMHLSTELLTLFPLPVAKSAGN